MKVYWTDNAVDHLAGIYEYIALNSSTYAKRMVPEYQAEDIRELIEKPYRIIYRVKQDRIDVLAVIHGARLLSEEM
jgi:toxin ParE1/3/4